jgi:hypothetical protein
LRANQQPYEAALQKGTETALKDFLRDFPGHVREADARQALQDITEGRDMVDLISEKKIEVETHGSGIQNVNLRIRKLVPYPLTVRIPVGTFFVSANAEAQNMVTTGESTVQLADGDWQEASAETACANRPKDIPGGEDTFGVQRSPHQAELTRLMPVLEKAGVDYAIRQAAVWIVTDDADYSDLGILVESYTGFGGSRVIGESQAARAMKICAEAGIDITQKAIWQDREQIQEGLDKQDALRAWLEKSGGKPTGG